MADKLTREEVVRRVAEVAATAQQTTCRTCDCFQGYLVQLELDACEDVADITGPLRVPREEMHGCLGCDPCPPGSHYSDYLRGSG